jgi:hypothetical protein
MENQENGYEIINFSMFEEADVMHLFGLKFTVNPTDIYLNWEKNIVNVTIEETEKIKLVALRKKMNFYIRGWNEVELREKFIAQIIEMVDFDNPELEVTAFSERFIEIIYENKKLRGKADWMVANGGFRPETPFFFIHEYKKEKDSSNDPVGQMLGAMCVAQLLNMEVLPATLFHKETTFEDLPMFGCYILGRFWFFAHLDWKTHHYHISKAYDATDEEDLNFIFKMLKAQREMIFDYMRANVMV